MPKYKYSKYKLKNEKDLEKKAVALYKTGLSCRAVGKVVGHSHEWVAQRVKFLKATEFEK